MADVAAVLSVSGLSLKPGATPFDLSIRRGEIVGLAGLDGHGQDAFIETLAGLRPPVTGEVRAPLSGHAITSFRRAVASGIAYLPRDRRATGIFPSMSILDNFAIATVGRDRRLGLISRAERRRRYDYYRERLAIVAPDPSHPITTLSGGNQQKVLLARALAHKPDVLLLNDPTRGVDIATRRVLYAVFRELAREGMALVVLSTEIEEALVLCDRILVFREQELAAPLEGDARSSERIIATMFGRATTAAAVTSSRAEGGRLPALKALWRQTGFAPLLFVILLVINIAINPARFAPGAWGTLIGLAAPLIGAAIASAPAILGGRGGIDISVGPIMGFVNAIVVLVLVQKLGLTSPFVVVGSAILIGAAVGALNGFLATILRIQPIVATLGTYLLLVGTTLTILPAPTGTVPTWLKALGGPLSILPLGAVFLAWFLIRRLPYYDHLMAVGSDDRAAYTAGIPVTLVRFLSYVITGVFAGVAGLMMTALIGSADPAIGPTYTLIAISAVALGGVSLAGGRGGLVGAAIGAIDIFLLQSALTFFNFSTFVLQIAYGAILVIAIVLTALQDRWLGRAREGR